jgi:long-chain acyl-CoA synthetase
LELTGTKRKLFFWAVNLGLNFDDRGENSLWYNIQLAIARKLIFSKWKDALGGNVIGIVTGAAALRKDLARVFLTLPEWPFVKVTGKRKPPLCLLQTD